MRRGPDFLRRKLRMTPRRRQVADLVLQALTDREIAGRLGIADKTAERHTMQLRALYGARNRVALALALQRESFGVAA